MKQITCVTARAAGETIEVVHTIGVIDETLPDNVRIPVRHPKSGYAIGWTVQNQLDLNPAERAPTTEGIGPVNDSINPWVGRASLWVLPELTDSARDRVVRLLLDHFQIYQARLENLIYKAEDLL